MPITRRRLFGFLAGAAAFIGVPTVWISRMKAYQGPVSDHFDGERFFDADGMPPKTLGEVLRWQFGGNRKRATWPDWVQNAHADTPPPRVEGNKVRLSRIAAKSSPRVITPLGNDLVMRDADDAIKAEGFDWKDRVELGNGVAVTLVPTRHWSARGLLDRNKSLWASFVLETPAGKLYIVCDSGYGDGSHFRRVAEAHGPLRLAILPIGAYEPRWFMRDQHMNPEDAVKALADCGAAQALAHHYGTFQLTDEAIDAPVIALGEALDQAKLPREKFAALKPGQVFEV